MWVCLLQKIMPNECNTKTLRNADGWSNEDEKMSNSYAVVNGVEKKSALAQEAALRERLAEIATPCSQVRVGIRLEIPMNEVSKMRSSPIVCRPTR